MCCRMAIECDLMEGVGGKKMEKEKEDWGM